MAGIAESLVGHRIEKVDGFKDQLDREVLILHLDNGNIVSMTGMTGWVTAFECDAMEGKAPTIYEKNAVNKIRERNRFPIR